MSESFIYSKAVDRLLAIPCEMPLKVVTPNDPGLTALSSLALEELFEGHTIADRAMAKAAEAALYLRFDSLDGAHAIINDLDSSTGSLLHGILHRREGDYPNARYWMHQAGNHPIYNYLAQGAGAILAKLEGLNEERLSSQIDEWDAIYYIKLCEQSEEAGGELAAFCGQVQDLEWQILFHFCYQSAIGEF